MIAAALLAAGLALAATAVRAQQAPAAPAPADPPASRRDVESLRQQLRSLRTETRTAADSLRALEARHARLEATAGEQAAALRRLEAERGRLWTALAAALLLGALAVTAAIALARGGREGSLAAHREARALLRLQQERLDAVEARYRSLERPDPGPKDAAKPASPGRP